MQLTTTQLATASKDQIQQAAIMDAQAACERHSSAALTIQMARTKLYVKYLEEHIRTITRDRLLRDGNQQLQGGKIEIHQKTSYEYNDPILRDLEEKVAKRKDYLKTVQPGQHLEEVDPATGELFRVQPPIKKGNETIVVTIQ